MPWRITMPERPRYLLRAQHINLLYNSIAWCTNGIFLIQLSTISTSSTFLKPWRPTAFPRHVGQHMPMLTSPPNPRRVMTLQRGSSSLSSCSFQSSSCRKMPSLCVCCMSRLSMMLLVLVCFFDACLIMYYVIIVEYWLLVIYFHHSLWVFSNQHYACLAKKGPICIVTTH